MSYCFFYFFYFLFIFYLFFICLVGNLRLDGLDVVLVEVALQVEVRERLRLRDGQQLTERGIRLDVVLVLQALLLDVRRDRLRDVGARHLAALRLAEEAAELLRQLRGDLEDGELDRLNLTIRILNANAALALASILDLAANTLLELLKLREEATERLAHRRDARNHRLDLLANRLHRYLRDRRRDRRSGGGNNRRDRRNRGRSRRLRLYSLGLRNLLLNRGRGRRRNRNRCSDRRNLLLLRNLRNRLLGGRGRGTHYTRTG